MTEQLYAPGKEPKPIRWAVVELVIGLVITVPTLPCAVVFFLAACAGAAAPKPTLPAGPETFDVNLLSGGPLSALLAPFALVGVLLLVDGFRRLFR